MTTQNETKKKPVVLLLLSGGKDSPEALRRLQAQGYDVKALCIDGIQGIEKVGAMKAASDYNVPLEIVQISYFDELTWNPFKLIRRDLAMGIAAIKAAKKVGAIGVATGVKKEDLQNPKLYWLYGFLGFGMAVLKGFGLKLLFPAWDYKVQKVSALSEEQIQSALQTKSQSSDEESSYITSSSFDIDKI